MGPAAETIKKQRKSVDRDNAVLKMEKAASAAISASLEYYRGVRDAMSEAAFFQTYGNVFSLYVADKREAERAAAGPVVEARELPFVKEALASIGEGGYAEALARVACLLARKGEPVLLSRLQMKQELLSEYRDLLPAMPPDQWRRTRGEQEIIVRYEPEQALATLPKLLVDRDDRQKLITLVQRLLADERVRRAKPSTRRSRWWSISATRSTFGRRKSVPRARAARRRRLRASALGRGKTMARKHEKYQRLLDFCKSLPATPTAVAHPCDESSLRGAIDAAHLGLIAPILVGPRARIEAEAKKHKLALDGLPIVDAPYSEASAAKAVELVREGKAEALMKGSLHTDELMGAVVRREGGLRTSRRVSHCFVMDVPSYAETLIVTDAAINIAPTLEDKVHIIQNAIDLAHALHFTEVRVAILSAMETINAKVPSTIEAGALCKMADRGQITGAILDGPLALDNAIDLESVKIKKIDSLVAGRANVLVVPDLEAGNMLAKSLSFLAGADAAGIVLGARVPIILTSRADSVTARLASCAVAALVAQARREAAEKSVA